MGWARGAGGESCGAIGIMLNDNDIMPFGVHKGRKLGEIPGAYFAWLMDQKWCEEKYPDLWSYALITGTEGYGE